MEFNKIYEGCCYRVLKTFADKSIHCIITSPPYWALRDYKVKSTDWPEVSYTLFGFEINIPAQTCCLGLEKDLFAFIGHLVLIFRECHRVLRDDGTMWVNMGDSYLGNGAAFGSKKSTLNGRKQGDVDFGAAKRFTKKVCIGKPKDIAGVPFMLAFALREDGWYWRQDIIWSKRNPMPESVNDRCTKSHEYILLFSKSRKPTIWRARDTGIWSNNPGKKERIINNAGKEVKRWKPYSYYFDAEAIATPYKDKTLTTFGCEVKGSGDGSGLVASENWANSLKVRSPKEWIKSGMFKDTTKFNGKNAGKRHPSDGAMPSHKNLQDKGQPPHSMHIVRLKGSGESDSIAINGSKIKGHSGNYDKNGNLIGDGRANKRSVWEVSTFAFKDAHFATFPPDLIVDCIKAGCPEGGIVLDIFGGSGTTAEVASKLNRNWILIEIGNHNVQIAKKRLHKSLGLFNPIKN
ncbi:MAG: site-specific DNA-methyltransferase [Chitinophagaceae bacterium]|nr:site-specific DNA-methyltransferase [Chitinophagaceae bacterium]